MSQNVKWRESHKPNEYKLPEALRSVPWKPIRDGWTDEVRDGDRIMFAVPIVSHRSRDGWEYDIEVVRLDCDGQCAHWYVGANGFAWGWDPDDADFFVRL